MIAPRMDALPFGLALLTALVLSACASTGTNRYWTAFAPTLSNFQRHFDERGADVDPIEGIWVTERLPADTFVIVRDSSFEGYDYVGVRFPAVTRKLPFTVQRAGDPVEPDPIDSTRGTQAGLQAEIFMALRRTDSDPEVYEYSDAAVIRGETCSDTPCHGVFSVTPDEELYRQRFAGERPQAGQGWARRYPPK
jgi:hypothetical protein